jgi:uncharacterized membrane protein YbhN (UPF0104 family)
MNFKNLIKYAKWLWIAAVLAAAIYYLLKNWARVSGYFAILPTENLILSALFLAAGKLILVMLSKIAVEGEGLTLTYSQIFRIVALSQLGKYIPGGVWHFVGRFNMYHEQEMSLKKSTKALIAENFWLLSGAVTSGLAFGLFSPYAHDLLVKTGVDLPTWAITCGGILVVIFWLAILATFDWFYRLKGQPVKLGNLLYLMILQILTWLLLGLSFAFVFPILNAQSLLLNISVYALSWIIGYVVIFAPGGIGIREAALVWMLAGFFSTEDVLIYSTVHRFIYFVVEILLGGLAWSLNTIKNPKKQTE